MQKLLQFVILDRGRAVKANETLADRDRLQIPAVRPEPDQKPVEAPAIAKAELGQNPLQPTKKY